MVLKKGVTLILFLCSFIIGFGQSSILSINSETDALQGWHLKDKSKDGFQGISLQQAYELLKGKKSTPVIVAVIDSGIDTLHEDLKPVLWRNAKEIPGNGKDDDKNGYADDVHGWNFLGGKDGRNVNEDSYEAARVYHRLKTKYSGKTDTTLLNAEEKNQYKLFIRAQGNLESGAKEAMEMIPVLRNLYYKSSAADSLLRIVYRATYNGNELIEFKPNNSKETDAKYVMITLYKAFDMMESDNKTLMKDFKEYYEGQERKAATLDAAPPSYRDDIVKDNYNDFNDKFYGNNDIMASHAMHGTHVSGIIAAARNNGVGIDGVADNVRIMTIRAVPDGDEHDKDIALGIRYAVDNGAKVINMSFGKSFSPEKKWVDDAVKYALSKDVLLVHAAGNDGKNIDESENYPNPEFIGTSIVASNFITVGASGDISTGGLAADFSNYGKNKVDVFAPGVKIYSSVPGGNTYAYQQGTSMASPVVAGIAALLRSYYPELTAVQIKYCIENGVAKIEGNVQKPGEEEEISFTLLSKTGGIVNALGAVNVAETLNPGVHNRHPIQSDPKIKLPNELPGNNNNSFTGNGTGFFINENGYIVTNYHVVKDASLIHAEYIVNNIKRIHSAQVILQDENNDLAILKINDPKFQPTPPIPFVFSSKSMDVGIEVFTIGYPFADVMGFAPKFSSGYISSLSGINDDSRFYQISVPLQPGNSGGPLFDNKGNLVGVTSGALNKELFNSENVNYAIKTILLKELINKLPNKINLPNDISIYNLTNENRIKRIQQFVPIIRVR